MKRTLAITAVALTAFAGAASAATNAGEINKYAPNVDVSTLSGADVATLMNFIHSGDSESDIRGNVQAFLK